MVPELNPDAAPLIRDLKKIRTLRWSKPDSFQSLEVLISHPAVRHRAAKPKEIPQRVKALNRVLTRTLTRIRNFEKRNPPPLGRSVAFASGSLLRLDKECEEMSVADIHRRIAGEWKRKDGVSSLSPDSLRQHFEDKDIYEPFAAELQVVLREDIERYELEANEAAEMEADPSSVEAKLRNRLREMENASHDKRLAAIETGALRIRDEEEMLQVLVLLTDLAQARFKAVDRTPLKDWLSKGPLGQYLDRQLKRVREGPVALERIRLVSEAELADPEEREMLLDFVARHERVSATLLLCPIEAAEALQISFQPHLGLLLVDDPARPLAVTGKLGDGSVGRALVYTQETGEVQELREEYAKLKEHVLANDLDAETRRRLTG